MPRTIFALLAGYALGVSGVWFGLRAAGVGALWRMVAVLVLGGLFLFYTFSRWPPGAAKERSAQEAPPQR